MAKDKSLGLKQPAPTPKYTVWKTVDGWCRSDQFGNCTRVVERDGEWVPE